MPLVDNGHGFLIDTDDPGEPGYADVRQRWSVHESELALLKNLATGRDVIEIGTGYGVATKALATYACTVCTVDIDPTIQKQVFPELIKLGIECFEEKPTGEWDLIFIDGCHLRDAVAADTAWSVHALAQGGLIVWHDWAWLSVREGVHDVLGPLGWCVLEIPSPAGMAIGFRP